MDKIKFKQIEIDGVSKKKTIASVIESLLFVSGEPLNLRDMTSILQCGEEYLIQVLDEMKSNYEEEYRGIQLINYNDSYQLVTMPKNNEYIQKLLRINSRQSLSQASLETLAIVAYKQPITRIEIDELRGVKSDSALNKLLDKNLIKESGRKSVPGRPILYEVTDEFFKYFGIKTLNDMPHLEELLKKYENLNDTIENNFIET